MTELSEQEAFRRDCLARHLLTRWSRQEIVDWLNDPKQKTALREDMRTRLNTQRHQLSQSRNKEQHP